MIQNRISPAEFLKLLLPAKPFLSAQLGMFLSRPPPLPYPTVVETLGVIWVVFIYLFLKMYSFTYFF